MTTTNHPEQLLSRGDFYLHQSLLHPLGVGIPCTLFIWIYLRFAPNRILSNLTKFDWIVSVTLGSTLSRVITGSADMLDMARGVLSLLVVVLFQLGLAYSTSLFPWSRRYIRASPQVVVFRGQMLIQEMTNSAVLAPDIRIGMRRAGVLMMSEIEVMVLEASGGFTVITRKMMDDAGVGEGQVPDSLMELDQYLELLKS